MGRLLKSIRIRNGLRQEDVAKKLNISITAYSQKETGKHDFSKKELLKLKEMFNLNAVEFFDVFFNEN